MSHVTWVEIGNRTGVDDSVNGYTKYAELDDYISLKMDAEQMTVGVRDVTYNLNKMGDRMSVVDTGNTKSYNPNNLNEYSSYADGIAISNNGQHQIYNYNYVTYSYRNDEQLTGAVRTNPSISYSLAYDALGRCVARTTSLPSPSPTMTKYYIYDGDRPIVEYDGGGNVTAKNVYGKGIDEILMRTDYTFNPARTYYFHQDHEGSVIHVTDTSGALIERYRYDVFGAPTIYGPSPTATPFQPQASTVSNRFMFTGREYAGAFGFYEYRARAYHPGLGRFTSEDPKLFDTGDYNLYRYCHNDPLDFTDPMGTSEEPGVKPPPTKPFDPVNPFNRSSGTGYSIDKWGPPGSFGKMDLSMAQLGQETRDRVILGGNATKPMDDPSHYTDEKLRNERGPAAEQPTTRLIANDDGTVSANVDAKVRRNLATRDPGLLPREWQHVNDWKNWIGRMNLPNSDLSTTFRNSPWDLKAAEAIRNFLAPYQRNEFITQKLRYDFKGGPHDVDYGLRE